MYILVVYYDKNFKTIKIMKHHTLYLTIISLLFFGLNTTNAQKMNNINLEKVLTKVSDSIRGGNGRWEVLYKGIIIYVITDENHNRMRMVTPTVEIDKLDEKYYLKALEANFHTALDVKYAVSEDVLWTAFIHPLKELSDIQTEDAIKQVYAGSVTFGTTYSSTDLSFPKND